MNQGWAVYFATKQNSPGRDLHSLEARGIIKVENVIDLDRLFSLVYSVHDDSLLTNHHVGPD